MMIMKGKRNKGDKNKNEYKNEAKTETFRTTVCLRPIENGRHAVLIFDLHIFKAIQKRERDYSLT